MLSDLASTVEVDEDLPFNLHADWSSTVGFNMVQYNVYFTLHSRVNSLCFLCTVLHEMRGFHSPPSAASEDVETCFHIYTPD